MTKGLGPIDAECQAREKASTAYEHLQHLLKVGYAANSMVIKSFCQQHGLERPRK